MDSETSVGMRALALMTEALVALDETVLPADIGAHLDLAIARLSQHLECTRSDPDAISLATG